MGEKAEVTRSRRVVFDINVAVSALVFRQGRLAWLREAWEAGHIVTVVSADTLSELVRVLAYSKLRLTEEEAKNVLAHYMERAEAVGKVGMPRIPQCRDPDDRMFLRLAYAARVQALVTGDKDLLAVAGKSRIPTLTPDALKTEMRM